MCIKTTQLIFEIQLSWLVSLPLFIFHLSLGNTYQTVLPTRLQLHLFFPLDSVSNIPERNENKIPKCKSAPPTLSLPVGNKLQINAAHARKMNPRMQFSIRVHTCTYMHVCAVAICDAVGKTKSKLLLASSCCCFFVIRNCFGLCAESCFEIGYTYIPRSSAEAEVDEWAWKLYRKRKQKMPALCLTNWSCSHALTRALCLSLPLSLSCSHLLAVLVRNCVIR